MNPVERARGMTLVKFLTVIAGAIFTVLLLLSAFFKFNLKGGPLLIPRFSFSEFIEELPGHLDWLVLFILLSAAILPLRAVQWQRTLPKKVPLKDRYHFVAIGAFAHNALPGKLGDVIRAFLLARSEKMPFLHGLGSVAVCKLLEFAALMLLVASAFLGPFGETMHQFDTALRSATILCVALVATVVLLAHYAEPLAQLLHRKAKFPRIQTFLRHVGEGLGAARSFRGLFLALLFSIPPVLAPALAYGLGLQGLGISGGLYAGTVVLGAIALGQALPGLPAGMGLYYFVTSWAARALGASPEDAAAYAVLTHLATVLTHTSVGAFSVWRRKISWKDLRRRSGDALAATRREQKEASLPDSDPIRV